MNGTTGRFYEIIVKLLKVRTIIEDFKIYENSSQDKDKTELGVVFVQQRLEDKTLGSTRVGEVRVKMFGRRDEGEQREAV